ncbi:hypothetical protein P7K49_022481 [Saguinus oedipus]|uniref:Uncharacterized protein n=1 Tax=Saguinus oedipus TaxID=9490 RepID=A0ABQ9UVH2_SAGOE|nr:hypothetical protein P7K49_022481 [Saguinus oedipus]
MAKEKKVVSSPTVMKKQEAKKRVNPCLRKGVQTRDKASIEAESVGQAEKKAPSKGAIHTKKPPALRARVNVITTLLDNKKFQLVVTAHQVDPIDLIVFLTALTDSTSIFQTAPANLLSRSSKFGVPRSPSKTLKNSWQFLKGFE